MQNLVASVRIRRAGINRQNNGRIIYTEIKFDQTTPSLKLLVEN
jgi:hypothetical protein